MLEVTQIHKPFCSRNGHSCFSLVDLGYAVAWSFCVLQNGFVLDIDGYNGATGELVNILDRGGRAVFSVFHDASNIIATRENAAAGTMAVCHKSLTAALNAFRRPSSAQRAFIAVAVACLVQRREQFGRYDSDYSSVPLPYREG